MALFCSCQKPDAEGSTVGTAASSEGPACSSAPTSSGWVLNYADLVSPVTGPAILRKIAKVFGQEGSDSEVLAMTQAMLSYSKDTSATGTDNRASSERNCNFSFDATKEGSVASNNMVWTQKDDSEEKLREARAVPGLQDVVDKLCLPLYEALQQHPCRICG